MATAADCLSLVEAVIPINVAPLLSDSGFTIVVVVVVVVVVVAVVSITTKLLPANDHTAFHQKKSTKLIV